jgi:uncharacterized membrane protein
MTMAGWQCAYAQEVNKRTGLAYILAGILFVLGLGYVYCVPPFEAPDEPAHFLRAWSVAELQVVMHDHPQNVAAYILDQMSQRHEISQNDLLKDIAKEVKKNTPRIPNFAYNTSLYPPLPYAFQAITISILKNRFSHSVVFYSSRIINLIIFTVAFFFFFRRLPSFQWPIFVFACTPMALSQAAMISLDGLLLSAVVIMLAVSLNPQLRIDGLLLVLAILCIGLTKSTYMILALFPFIPLFMRKRFRLLFIIGLLLTISLIMVWNYCLDKENIIEMFVYFVQNYALRNVDPVLQFKYVMDYPVNFIYVLFSSLFNDIILYGKQFVGVLGWLDIHLYMWVYITWLIIMILSLLTVYEPKDKWINIVSIWGAILSLTTVVVIFLSLYLIWMPIYARTIEIQGRYLHTPFLVFVISLCFFMPYVKKIERIIKFMIPSLSIVINVGAMMVLFNSYN